MKLTCECGWLMSNSGDANGVEFRLLYDVDEFHLDEKFEAFYASLPKNEMAPWRVKDYLRTPLHMWRCPRCMRLYVFNTTADHKLSQRYYPQEVVLPVEALPTYQILLEQFEWKYVAENGASYFLSADVDAFDLVGNSLMTRHFSFKGEPWEVWITALPDGGIITYEPERFQFGHYLYTQAEFGPALTRLPLPHHEIRQLRLLAWARGKAMSEAEFERLMGEGF